MVYVKALFACRLFTRNCPLSLSTMHCAQCTLFYTLDRVAYAAARFIEVHLEAFLHKKTHISLSISSIFVNLYLTIAKDTR